MLFKLDKALGYVPSKAVNIITCGSKGASMCGRLYLYKRYISEGNWLVNILFLLLESIEKDHCEVSARVWKIRHRSGECTFPKIYNKYLTEK